MVGILLSSGCANATDSPEALSRAVVKAANKRDKEGLRSLWATEELLKASIECSDDAFDELRRSVERDRERMVEAATRGDEKEVQLEWVSLEQDEEKVVASGDSIQGCKARIPLIVKRVHIKAKLQLDDKSEDKSLGLTMTKFGDKGWLLVDR